MPFKIVRNNIVKMDVEAIVNTANSDTVVGSGCDYEVYSEAGFDELLDYRKKYIGIKEECEVFLTPGFNLKAKKIIHAVSPKFMGDEADDQKLGLCYQNCLSLVKKEEIKSVAFPLISTGSFAFPKEIGMRIAIDEIKEFLKDNDILIYIVVFDEASHIIGRKLFPDLQSYIDRNYVEEKTNTEYGFDTLDVDRRRNICANEVSDSYLPSRRDFSAESRPMPLCASPGIDKSEGKKSLPKPSIANVFKKRKSSNKAEETYLSADKEASFSEEHESKLDERIAHLTDTFSEYLLYLIQDKGMDNSDVWHRGIVDRKVFSKMKNNPSYHPQKLTALCLCIGACLNLDETRDLLSRAGYALSPCDKTDIIFSYFIENGIYDMVELDIQLEEHGLPPIIV